MTSGNNPHEELNKLQTHIVPRHAYKSKDFQRNIKGNWPSPRHYKRGRIFSTTRQPLLGQGLLIFEAFCDNRTHTHMEDLFWVNDQPEAETSTW
jgi:hypothetical protein